MFLTIINIFVIAQVLGVVWLYELRCAEVAMGAGRSAGSGRGRCGRGRWGGRVTALSGGGVVGIGTQGVTVGRGRWDSPAVASLKTSLPVPPVGHIRVLVVGPEIWQRFNNMNTTEFRYCTYYTQVSLQPIAFYVRLVCSLPLTSKCWTPRTVAYHKPKATLVTSLYDKERWKWTWIKL